VPVIFCHNLAVKEFPLLWTKQQFQDICSWRERERLKKRDILSANPDARALSLAKTLDKRYAQMLAMGTETSCLRDTETPQLPSEEGRDSLSPSCTVPAANTLTLEEC
jgi:hypothetical protein